MTTYHSSDWHLGHERIIPLCARPFETVDEMNSCIIERANEVVTEKDALVLHGDNVMGTYRENVKLLTQLRAGFIVLMPGNHDRFSIAHQSNKPARRESEFQALRAMDRRFRPVRDKIPSAWPHRLLGHKVLLSHYPYAGDSGEKDRHVDMRPVDAGLPLIHGHVHEKWRENGRMLNVGVDVWDFAPVSEETIADWVSTNAAEQARS